MRIKVKLKQLRKPEAQFLSLVRRSANQIPFRIQKQADEEKTMDLTSLKRVFKGQKEPAGPVIAAVVVQKGEDFEAVKAAVQKAGYSVESPVENADGTVAFAQVESPEQGATAIRMNEQLVLVVKGAPEQVKPYAATLGTEGYVDSILPATAALAEVVKKATATEDHEAMKVAVQKAVQDYADFVMGLVEVLPPTALSLADELVTVRKAWFEKKQKDMPQGEKVEEKPAEKPEEEKPADEAKAEEKPVEEKPAEEKAAPAKSEDSVPPLGQPPDDPTTPTAQQEAAPDKAAAAPEKQEQVSSNATATTPVSQQTDPDKGKPPTQEEKEKPAEEKPAESTEEKPAEESTEEKPKKENPFAKKGVKKEDEVDPLDKVMAAIAALGAQMETVKKSVEDRVSAVEAQVAETVKKSAEVAQKLGTTVAAPPPAPDLPSRETVAKSDDGMGWEFMDTARGKPWEKK